MSWMTPDRPKQIIIKHYKPQHPLLQAEIGFSIFGAKRAAKKAKTKAKTKANLGKSNTKKRRPAIAGLLGSFLPPKQLKKRIFEDRLY